MGRFRKKIRDGACAVSVGLALLLLVLLAIPACVSVTLMERVCKIADKLLGVLE